MRIISSKMVFISSVIFSLSLGTSLVLADPPEHAPAHGTYKNSNQGHDNYQRKKYDDHDSRYQQPRSYNDNKHGNYRDDRYNYNRNQGHSNNPQQLSCDPKANSNSPIGTVIGGVLGGILGSNIGKGKGKTLATIAGVIVGGVVGNKVSSSMNEQDRYCAGQALGHAQDNQAVAWTNPDTHQQYTVTPQRTYTQNNGQQCRDYTSNVVINGHNEKATGTACKDHDGNWKIIN